MKMLTVAALLCTCFGLATLTSQTASGISIVRNPLYHSDRVVNLSSNIEKTLFLSSSVDGTAILFTDQGRVLNKFRLPFQIDNPAHTDGMVYSAELSPDGTLVALGGWIENGSSKAFSVILYDAKTTEIVDRINNLPGTAKSLAFSPNGAYLAIGLDAKKGIRLFNLKTKTVDFVDSSYRGTILDIDFNREGTFLAVAGDTDKVALYDFGPTISKRSEYELEVNEALENLEISSDSKHLILGYRDVPKAQILAIGPVLELERSIKFDKKTSINLKSVTFGPQEREIMAVSNKTKGSDTLTVFSNDLSKKLGEFALTGVQNPMQLVSFNDGGFAVSFWNGEIRAFNKDFTLRWEFTVDSITFDGFGQIRVSKDGSEVRLQDTAPGVRAAVFSTKNLRLMGKNSVELLAPERGTLPVKPDQDYRLSFKGQTLVRYRSQVLWGWAADTKAEAFVVALSSFVVKLDAFGREVFNISVRSRPNSIIISPDSRYIITRFTNGYVQWHRYSDGRLMLTLLVNKDQSRWVAWTQSGYYAASAGGEDMIAWVVQHGPNQAPDFYPAKQFQSYFNRPDIVSRVLDFGDESETIKTADLERGLAPKTLDITQVAPPTVSIISTGKVAKPKNALEVKFKIRRPNEEPINKISFLIDGRPTVVNSGLRLTAQNDDELSQTLVLPPRDCTVAIIAENAFGASLPVSTLYRYEGETTTTPKPKLKVLSIGISDYLDENLRLRYAAKDATDFVQALSSQKGLMYDDVETKLLVDTKATKEAIIDGLDWINSGSSENDICIIFFAGHGVNDSSGTYFFLPIGADVNKIGRTALPYTDFVDTIKNTRGKVVCFIDTCHSGNILGSTRGYTNSVVSELSSGQVGAVVFTASTGNQYSYESSIWNNGVFTKAVVEGISGAADYYKTGSVNLSALDLYISDRVRDLTDGQQTPTTIIPSGINDFVISYDTKN